MALRLYERWSIERFEAVRWAERSNGSRVKIIVHRKFLHDSCGFTGEGENAALQCVVANESMIVKMAEALDQTNFNEIRLS